MSSRSAKKTARRQARKNATKTRQGGTSGVASPSQAAEPQVRSNLATAVRAAAPQAPARVADTPAEAATAVASPSAESSSSTGPAATGCAAEMAATGLNALAATYWLDSDTNGPPRSVTIRFTGTRVGVQGAAGPGDLFDRVEQVDGIAQGHGRVAITTRVSGINAGEWRVNAIPIQQAGTPRSADGPAPELRLPRRDFTVHTRLINLAHGPGVRPWAWPALVGLGAVLAIILQAVLLARANVDIATTTMISVAACVVGFISAKVWYLVQNREHPRTFLQAGACIQGFLVGGIGTIAIGVTLAGLPLGTIVDASTPGLFLGMALGRPGCWFTGCCSGRPTTSRWGLWSSDRRVGIRRVPIQLAEAAFALVIGVTTLTLMLTTEPPVAGVVFLGAIAAYTLGRQVLFPFRSEPRKTTVGRLLTIAVSALVLLADLAVAVLA